MKITTILNPSERLQFEFESYIKTELGLNLDKPINQEVCQYYLKNQCRLGVRCQYKHPSKTKLVVCKHWLRGLCKKGEMCEFLHEYNLKKMPECWFYTKLGECTNPECQYLHIDPNSNIKDCAWYARGFCKHGSLCRNKHSRAAVCPVYLTGFCPKGNNCTFAHPKWDLPTANAVNDNAEHSEQQAKYQQQARQQPSEITCYKCGGLGHFANVCTSASSKRQRVQ